MAHFPGNNAYEDDSFWYKGLLLPHYDRSGLFQCITYRLADSIPQSVLREKMRLTDQNLRRKLIEDILDQGLGSCRLKEERVAQVILKNWRHFEGKRYSIIAYVIMPNHCHILIDVFEGVDLAQIVQSWKTYTAKGIHSLYPSDDKHVWQLDYWDRYIRNESHYLNCIEYIHQNPVKAGLCKQSTDWKFSSANS